MFCKGVEDASCVQGDKIAHLQTQLVAVNAVMSASKAYLEELEYFNHHNQLMIKSYKNQAEANEKHSQALESKIYHDKLLLEALQCHLVDSDEAKRLQQIVVDTLVSTSSSSSRHSQHVKIRSSTCIQAPVPNSRLCKF